MVPVQEMIRSTGCFSSVYYFHVHRDLHNGGTGSQGIIRWQHPVHSMSYKQSD